MSRDQSSRSPWPSSLSDLFRQGLVVHDLVVMMMHRVLHDVMMTDYMMVVVADHMMMAVMLNHYLLRRGGRCRCRIGTACGKHRGGECDRYGEADRGKECRLHGMFSLA
jgi:hypothetical protein